MITTAELIDQLIETNGELRRSNRKITVKRVARDEGRIVETVDIETTTHDRARDAALEAEHEILRRNADLTLDERLAVLAALHAQCDAIIATSTGAARSQAIDSRNGIESELAKRGYSIRVV